jgi:rhodanese-related sulfurtransferase
MFNPRQDFVRGVPMQPRELAEKIAAGQSPAVVDVRTGMEFRSGHIPGAINAPIWKIMLHLAPLPSDKRAAMVVLCELGPRAVMAKALLGLFGYRTVLLLTGHMAAWRRSGLSLEKDEV